MRWSADGPGPNAEERAHQADRGPPEHREPVRSEFRVWPVRRRPVQPEPTESQEQQGPEPGSPERRVAPQKEPVRPLERRRPERPGPSGPLRERHSLQ